MPLAAPSCRSTHMPAIAARDDLGSPHRGQRGRPVRLTGPSAAPSGFAAVSTGTNIFDVGGGFLDLQVTNAGPNDTLTAKFYYPTTITGQTETDLKLFFFNGTNWQAIKSSGGADPVKDTTDNLDDLHQAAESPLSLTAPAPPNCHN